MMQMQLQMKQLHRQAKAQLLGSLSSAHRTLLETVIGQQALSEHPDRKAAAAKLDAALSSGERAAILKIHADTAAKARAMMENAHKQMMSSMPADVRAQADKLHAAMAQEMASHPKRTPPTAGALLLGMAHRGGAMPGMMGRMHRGMMGEGMMGPGTTNRRVIIERSGPGMGPGDGMMPPGGAMRRRPMGTPPPPQPAPTAS